MDKTTSESHPLTAVIVDMLNEEIKENILTVEVEQSSTTMPKEYVSDLVKRGARINTVKILRSIFGWGLKECKDYMDSNWDKWLSTVTK